MSKLRTGEQGLIAVLSERPVRCALKTRKVIPHRFPAGKPACTGRKIFPPERTFPLPIRKSRATLYNTNRQGANNIQFHLPEEVVLNMKLHPIMFLLLTSAIAVGYIAVGRNAAQAGSFSFVCKPNANGTHTTFALTENGEREFIRWRSDDFTLAGYPPKRRCEEVTARMNDSIASGSERYSYITHGMMNKQPVICVTNRSGGGCTGLLYTLKRDQDAKETLRDLLEMNARNFRKDYPLIEGKSCRIYVDFKAWLGGNSKYAEVACSPQ